MPEIPPLEPPDSMHLEAAQGWLDLDSHLEANEELEKIAPGNRVHPDVLQVRWRIYARAAKWAASLDVATALTERVPERRFGWIHRAISLHRLGRTREALDLISSVKERFEPNSTIPFYQACFASRLGRQAETWQFIEEAIQTAEDPETRRRLRKRVMHDPDLAPMRVQILKLLERLDDE